MVKRSLLTMPLGRRVRRRVVSRGLGPYSMRAVMARRVAARRALMYRSLGSAGGALAVYGAYRAYKYIRHKRLQGTNHRTIRNGIYGRGDANFLGTMTRGLLGCKIINMAVAPAENDSLRNSPGMDYFLKGFSVETRAINVTGTPIVIHHAIVQLKAQWNDSGSIQNQVEDDLFTNPHASADRTVSWNSSTAVWQGEQESLRINPDKFNIFFHKRIILAPNQGYGNGQYYHYANKYYKVNKTFAFETKDGEHVSQPLIELTWVDALCGIDPAVVDLAQIRTKYTAFIKSK